MEERLYTAIFFVKQHGTGLFESVSPIKNAVYRVFRAEIVIGKG
jgi:hypothetical protein